MPKYDNLPVYKAAYDLLLDVSEALRKVDRDLRFSLGEKIRNEIDDVLIYIYWANTESEKLPIISLARKAIVGAKIHIRLLHDMKGINIARFALQSKMAEDVLTQLTNWHKSIEGKKGSSDESSE